VKILLADDDDQIRAGMTRVLERMGHEVTAACDGQQALDTALAGAFDLIVSDHDMPRLSGLQLHEALPAAMRERFILHSGNHEVLEGLEGRIRTVQKGMPVSEFRRAVQETLALLGAPGS